MFDVTSKSTSIRGIQRIMLRNDLYKANRRVHHGRYLNDIERQKANAERKEGFIQRGQTIFGAMFRRKPKETIARKAQGK